MKKVAMLFMANQLPNENCNAWKIGQEINEKPITDIKVFSQIGDLMSHYIIYCEGVEVARVNASHVEAIYWDLK